MDLSPRGIREHLRLNKPIYARTSAYGHFGRAPDSRGRLLLGEDRSGRAACVPWSRRRPWRKRRRDARARRALYGRSKGKALRAASRPPGRRASARARTRRGDARLAGAAVRLRAARTLARNRLRRRRASDRPGQGASRRRLHRMRALRQRGRQGAGGARASRARQRSAAGGRRARADRSAAARVAVAHLHSLSRPLAQAPPQQTSGDFGRDDRRARARGAAGGDFALRHRHRRLRRLDAQPLSRFAGFSMDGANRRRLADPLGRLVADPLRGQGARRGPRFGLFDVHPPMNRGAERRIVGDSVTKRRYTFYLNESLKD